ncbi:MAG: GNAT family N-acetyltransferase [Acidobacteria bacterium]|nr:MAG: GNAT family N-acetyltransferase [Acidobacteriota bacterium]
MTVVIEPISANDHAAVLSLLENAELPTAGASEHISSFLVARDGDKIVGCIGLEAYGDVALLRSLAATKDVRGSGVGRRLVEGLIVRARSDGVSVLYLLTTTADEYFPRFGFERITRGEIDERVQASEELRGACPDTAICMRLGLSI